MHRIPSVESRLSPEFLAHLDQENRRKIVADLNEELIGVIFPGLSGHSRPEICTLMTLKFSILYDIDRLVGLSHEMMEWDISPQYLQAMQQEFLSVVSNIYDYKKTIKGIMLKTHE